MRKSERKRFKEGLTYIYSTESNATLVAAQQPNVVPYPITLQIDTTCIHNLIHSHLMLYRGCNSTDWASFFPGLGRVDCGEGASEDRRM